MTELDYIAPWVPGDVGGGGGLTLGSTADLAVSNGLMFPFDNSIHAIPFTPTQPFDWIDADSGYIILPGLYLSGLLLIVSTPPTSPGLYGAMYSQFNTVTAFSVDGAIAMDNIVVTDTQALDTNDVPYTAFNGIRAQTDATGQFTVQSFIYRLAY